VKKRSLVLAAVLLGGLMFVSGVVADQYLMRAPNGQNDKFKVEGFGVVKAYNAQGVLFATWSGYNVLTPNGENSIASCLSGVGAGTSFDGSCNGITTAIHADDTSYAQYTGTATNSLYPSGCNPYGNPGTCTGWQSVATISFSSITTSVTIMRAGADGSSGGDFDLLTINPEITVNPGDTLVVTITFAVT
jgi:hypothetical protein